jgi:hypothetical protein
MSSSKTAADTSEPAATEASTPAAGAAELARPAWLAQELRTVATELASY